MRAPRIPPSGGSGRSSACSTSCDLTWTRQDDRRADGGSGVVVEEFLKSAGYGAIFALSFISAMGLPVGAELALIYGGVLASGQVPGEGKPLNLAVVIVVATLGEVLGSGAGYSIGRFGGRTLVDRVGKYVLLTHKDLDRAEAWFARRGEPVVLVGRFIPLLRSFVSFAAGLGEMAVAKFTIFTVIGCASGAPPCARSATASAAATTTCSRRSAWPATSSGRWPSSPWWSSSGTGCARTAASVRWGGPRRRCSEPTSRPFRLRGVSRRPFRALQPKVTNGSRSSWRNRSPVSGPRMARRSGTTELCSDQVKSHCGRNAAVLPSMRSELR